MRWVSEGNPLVSVVLDEDPACGSGSIQDAFGAGVYWKSTVDCGSGSPAVKLMSGHCGSYDV